MSIEIKNGKLGTNYIYCLKLLFLFAFFIIASGSAYAFKSDKKWVIVIDAGHGGKDPGAVGSLDSEKNITLAIALKTGKYIEENINNVTVLYTRKNDIFVDIWERANIANKNNADLFISIHANWAESKSVKGSETYIMGLAMDQQNLEVAMKENEVILLEKDHTTKYEGFDPKSPESYIMFTLMQNIFQEQSTGLASKIQTQYIEKVDRINRGVKQAGFVVLYKTTMPSVLTETGFITNPSEEKFLNSGEGQDYLASAIYRACREYINEIDNKSGISAVKSLNDNQEQDDFSPAISTSKEIIFMVQVASTSSRTEIKPENFKGIKDIIEINVQNSYKYATGRFTDFSTAAKYRKKIEADYPDAYVIAVKDNKILPLQKALEQKMKK